MATTKKMLLRRAAIAARLLRLVPFLRFVALNGSVATGTENEKSDLDFLIIARPGRLYTARAFAIFWIGLTLWRRHGRDPNPAGKICLNCFLSGNNPDITPKNPKSRHKVAASNKFLVTLVDSGGQEQNFIKNNQWMERFEIGGRAYSQKLKKQLVQKGPSRPINLFEPILSGRVGNFVEKKLMNYQIKRIMRGIKRADETVATASEIRLHPKKD